MPKDEHPQATPDGLDPLRQPRALSELIGLIYEAALDKAVWPKLLGGLCDMLALEPERAGSAPRPLPDAGAWLADCLAPHFERAQEIPQELDDLATQRDSLEEVLSRVPLGLAVVRGSGELVSLNRSMASIAHGVQGLRVCDGRLISQPPGLLSEALARAQQAGGQEQVVTLPAGPDSRGGSLWVSRLRRAARGQPPLMLVLVASAQSRALTAESLSQWFRLTPAEARLAQLLVLGHSSEEACQALDMSINTAKTHLKRIFAKVGVRRQSELVQAVYASPLWLQGGMAVPQDAAGLTQLLARREASGADDGELRLPDGRRLTYSDQGDLQGFPVVLMHGLGGSRYLRHPDDSLLLKHGLRLIIPERPGCGNSDPQPGRQLSDWLPDMDALARHLGLSRFAVLGYSAGTPYALATALSQPERVSALHLVAPVPPIERLADLRFYPPVPRLQLLMARHAPALLPMIISTVVKDMRKNVFRYIEHTMAEASASDRAIYESPPLRTAHAVGLLAGVKHGGQALTDDVLVSCGDWGLDFSRLQVRTHIWQGDNDHAVLPEGARALASRLPDAELTLIPGGGHFILYSCWDRILGQLASELRAQAASAQAA